MFNISDVFKRENLYKIFTNSRFSKKNSRCSLRSTPSLVLYSALFRSWRTIIFLQKLYFYKIKTSFEFGDYFLLCKIIIWWNVAYFFPSNLIFEARLWNVITIFDTKAHFEPICIFRNEICAVHQRPGANFSRSSQSGRKSCRSFDRRSWFEGLKFYENNRIFFERRHFLADTDFRFSEVVSYECSPTAN